MANFNPAGLFVTEVALNEVFVRDSLAENILRLDPNGDAQIYAMTGDFKSKKAYNVLHGYTQKKRLFPSVVVDDATDLNSTDTALVVDDVNGVVPGMVFQVPATGELIRVTAIVSATALTIQRGIGRIAAGVILDNAVLFGIGTAYERASARPTEMSIAPVFVPNYTVIVRNAWAMSDTDAEIMTINGWNNLAENKLDAAMLHAQYIEGWIIWGQPKIPTADAGAGNRLRSATQGVIDAVKQYADASNTTQLGSTTTYEQLETALEPMFTFNSELGSRGVRAGFCGNNAFKVIQHIGRKQTANQQILNEMTNNLGMRWHKVIIGIGVVNLMIHPMLNGVPGHSNTMIVVDLPAMSLAYLGDRNAKREEYTAEGRNTDAGRDAIGGSITTEFATEIRNPDGCGYLTNFTAGAASS